MVKTLYKFIMPSSGTLMKSTHIWSVLEKIVALKSQHSSFDNHSETYWGYINPYQPTSTLIHTAILCSYTLSPQVTIIGLNIRLLHLIHYLTVKYTAASKEIEMHAST